MEDILIIEEIGLPGAPGIAPHIGINGNWYIGDADTGVKAQAEDGAPGIAPHIGINGNWYIGDADTGVKAQAEDGAPGIAPHIGINGNWYVGDTDTGVNAQGPKGDPAEIEIGSVGVADTVPVIDGVYRAKEAGAHTNLGGLVAKEGYITWFKRTSGVWTVYSEVKLDIVVDTAPVKDSLNPISSDAIYRLQNYNKTTNLADYLLTNSNDPSPGYKTLLVGSIEEGESYIQSNEKNNIVSPYIIWLNDSFVPVSDWTWVSVSIVAPAGSSYILLRFSESDDLEKYQFEKGNEATSWKPHSLPKGLEFAYTKLELDIRDKSDKVFNENVDYPVTSSALQGVVVGGYDYIEIDKVKETDPEILGKGIFESYKFSGLKAGYVSSYTFAINYVNSRKFKKYFYVSTIISTDDPDIFSKLNLLKYWGIGAILSWNKIDIIRQNGDERVFKVSIGCETNNQTASLQIVIGISSLLSNKNYRISGYSFMDADNPINLSKMILDREGSDITSNFSLYKAVEFDKQTPVVALDRERRGLVLNVFGTSIDAMNDGGTTIWDKVAAFYGLKLNNHSLGGSTITFDPTPAAHDYINNAEILQNDRSWSCTETERESFMSLVNRHASQRYSGAGIALCYNNSMIPFIETSDLTIISTYGANDPDTLPSLIENACKVTFSDGSSRLKPNRARLWEIYRQGDSAVKSSFFDRSNLFGAYNYMIREIRKVKPTSKIILTGLNSFQFDEPWDGGRRNDIVRIVAELWQIPFLDMADELACSKMPVFGGDMTHQYFTGGGDIHPWTDASRKHIADYIIRKLQVYL